MDILAKFNLFEAIFWFVIGGLFLLFGYKVEKLLIEQKKACIFLSAMFVLFGISDLIEIRTGAWWRPAWLLLLKGVCLVGIICGIVYFLRKNKSRNS